MRTHSQHSTTKISYVDINGREHIVSATVGATLMETARDNGVPGIDADCYGGCSCGTCHVFVDDEWFDDLDSPGPLEEATLELSLDVRPFSRLSCQIRVREELDGLVVYVPRRQQ